MVPGKVDLQEKVVQVSAGDSHWTLTYGPEDLRIVSDSTLDMPTSPSHFPFDN